jgi:hypothetical protein
MVEGFRYTVDRETVGQVVPVSFSEEKTIPWKLVSLLGRIRFRPSRGAARSAFFTAGLWLFRVSRSTSHGAGTGHGPIEAVRCAHPELAVVRPVTRLGPNPTPLCLLGGGRSSRQNCGGNAG